MAITGAFGDLEAGGALVPEVRLDALSQDNTVCVELHTYVDEQRSR